MATRLDSLSFAKLYLPVKVPEQSASGMSLGIPSTRNIFLGNFVPKSAQLFLENLSGFPEVVPIPIPSISLGIWPLPSPQKSRQKSQKNSRKNPEIRDFSTFLRNGRFRAFLLENAVFASYTLVPWV